MFDNILVPTDGSDCAWTAVRYAEDLAARYDATIHVLCVVDSHTLEDDPHRQQLEDESAELVASVRSDIAAATGTVEGAVRTGIPHREIIEYATQQDVDLVAMGTHGRTGVERYLLGSVTQKVVRLSDVPVLTVGAADDGATTYPYSDVLIPTDGSDQAAAAIDVGVDIAKTYDARLHALSVIDTMAFGADARPADILDMLDDAAQEAVGAVEADAIGSSVSAVETAVEYGHPYRKIRSYVDANDVDLIVMGTHGRSGLERYLLGSVTEKVVRTSAVPVLTVRSSTDA